MKTKTMLSVMVVGLLFLPMLAVGAGFVDVGRFMEKQSVASCEYCIDPYPLTGYSCTSCDIEVSDCFKYLIYAPYACCTSTVMSRDCDDMAFDSSGALGYSYFWAKPNQPCRPRDLCPFCPTGYCIHAPQPSEECEYQGEVQTEPGATYCGT